MSELWSAVISHVAYFPLAALACLLLAGLSLPFSEDLIIITAALVSAENPQLLGPNLAAIYSGVFVSDIIAYGIGVRIRSGAARFNVSARLVKQKRLDTLKRYLGKNGLLTFIIFRFIPFGIRNTLFVGSGILGLRFRLFLFYDLIAGAISTNVLFFLVYNFGEEIKKPFKATGIVLFALLIAAVMLWSVLLMLKKRRKNRARQRTASGET